MSNHNSLKVTEIFCSLQGEARHTGIPTTFIRLTGCPLRCHYCDTAYAFFGGKRLLLDEILAKVDELGVYHVTVTGGEPLAQPACIDLLIALVDRKYIVSLETSGALSVANVYKDVHKVLDLKTPASGEVSRNMFTNLQYLTCQDQIKIVICDEADYIWAKQIIAEHKLVEICEILLSPSYGQLSAEMLADWIVRDRLPVRFQIQLHKQLWGDKPGV